MLFGVWEPRSNAIRQMEWPPWSKDTPTLYLVEPKCCDASTVTINLISGDADTYYTQARRIAQGSPSTAVGSYKGFFCTAPQQRRPLRLSPDRRLAHSPTTHDESTDGGYPRTRRCRQYVANAGGEFYPHRTSPVSDRGRFQYISSAYIPQYPLNCLWLTPSKYHSILFT